MRVLVVHCHPDPESLVAAARDRVVAGLHRGGHEVRLRDLYAERFEPELPASEWAHHLHDPVTKPAIADHVADLRWCDAIVLVYPTWWSGQPAMLKGWIDRVWVQGVAWTARPGRPGLRPGLTNVRRLVAVTTHGSSKWINALEGEAGKRTFQRTLRALCHRRCRTTWLACYGLDRADHATCQRFLWRVEDRVARLR